MIISERTRIPNLPRLFVHETLSFGLEIKLEDNQFHYLSHVLRKKPQDLVLLLDGKTGLWQAKMIDVQKKYLRLIVTTHIEPFLKSPDIRLYFAPIKLQRLDIMIEKATELGVSAFCPVLTQYAQVKDMKQEKLIRIAQEAAEQCERHDVPSFFPIIPLKDLKKGYDSGRHLLMGDERLGASSLCKVLKDMKGPIDLLIGPEGGFSPEEHGYLESLPFVRSCHFGPRILRSETAALFGLAMIGGCYVDPCF